MEFNEQVMILVLTSMANYFPSCCLCLHVVFLFFFE